MIELRMSLGPSRVRLIIAALVVMGSERVPAVLLPLNSSSSSDFTSTAVLLRGSSYPVVLLPSRLMVIPTTFGVDGRTGFDSH